MSDSQSKKLSPGGMVILTRVPQGLLDGLPREDQQAICQVIGKPVLLSEYDDDGKAELKFTDDAGRIHFIRVQPTFLQPVK
jgi:hypothetical protein